MTLNLVISVLALKHQLDFFPYFYLENVSCRSEILSFQIKAEEGRGWDKQGKKNPQTNNLLRC